jgi:hypothetical protein
MKQKKVKQHKMHLLSLANISAELLPLCFKLSQQHRSHSLQIVFSISAASFSLSAKFLHSLSSTFSSLRQNPKYNRPHSSTKSGLLLCWTHSSDSNCSFWFCSSPYSSKDFDSNFPFAYGYLKKHDLGYKLGLMWFLFVSARNSVVIFEFHVFYLTIYFWCSRECVWVCCCLVQLWCVLCAWGLSLSDLF